jgi:hypothetical protein
MEADAQGRPLGYEICACCRTQFGKSEFDIEWDYGVVTDQHAWLLLRKAWIDAGAPWSHGDPPEGWEPSVQLERAFGAPAHKLASPPSA